MKQEKPKSGALRVISAKKITPEHFMKRLSGHKVEEMKTSEREIVQLGNKEMNLLRQAIGTKQTKCYYCKEKIDFKKDKFGIFNKPTRLICNSEFCITIALEEDEQFFNLSKNFISKEQCEKEKQEILDIDQKAIDDFKEQAGEELLKEAKEHFYEDSQFIIHFKRIIKKVLK